MNRERLMDHTDYTDYAPVSLGHEASRLSPFVVGAIAGAAVALLFAPMTGRESRARIKDGLRGARHRLGDAKDALEEGKHAVRDAVETGKEAVRETVAAAREGFNRSREELGYPGTSAPGSTTGSRKL